MQQMGTPGAGSGADRKNVEAIAQTLVVSPDRVEGLAEVAHDARNMVAALGLYCELLEEPGVLTESFAHYGGELRLVASASQRLVEKLIRLDRPTVVKSSFWKGESVSAERWPARLPGDNRNAASSEGWDWTPSVPVANMAAELLSTRNLLSALAGPAIAVTVDAESGACPVRITAEDLTRVLVNLVKNAVEAMPAGGHVRISLREGMDDGCLVLAVEDNGPGIPEEALDQIFDSGFTGHARQDGRPGTHRGLGLAITRAIVETAGGRIHAENRSTGGARLVMELPS